MERAKGAFALHEDAVEPRHQIFEWSVTTAIHRPNGLIGLANRGREVRQITVNFHVIVIVGPCQ
jgi:hypothetical protein